MSIDLDYKVTSWVRVKGLEKEQLDEIIEKIDKEGLPLALLDYDLEYESLTETEEHMSIGENDGQQTVEISDNIGNILWDDIRGKRL